MNKSAVFICTSPQGDDPRFITAEQGLRFGHIFHVTSKAAEGFSEEDMQRYAPELGASFRLHYFAVMADMLETRVINGEHPTRDPEVELFAENLLAGGDSDYCLVIPGRPITCWVCPKSRH